MKIGFIGAGRMGFTLGKHLTMCAKNCEVLGYFTKNPNSAKEAAKFTNTKYYEDIKTLVSDSDIIFITVPDMEIATIVDKLGRLEEAELKIICHTSGALSSQVFSGMNYQCFGYSIHPIYAVNSKTDSYKNFRESFITIEGHEKYLQYFIDLFLNMGHRVKSISLNNKNLYHAGTVMASNLVVGLYAAASKILGECGFNENEQEEALSTLFLNNAKNIVSQGTKASLTGPIDRNDFETVSKHLSVMNEEFAKIYTPLSKEILEIAEDKYPEKDFSRIKQLLDNKYE